MSLCSYNLMTIYPEYIPLEDEHILLAEEQTLPPVVSPTVESPGYVAKLDPEEDPEEYEEDEAKDSPVDYPMDGGDDDDDDNSSRYDVDDEDGNDEEEEEEHLASAEAAIIIPIDELVSPPEGTEPIIPPPSTDTTTIGARITIRPHTSISLPLEAEVERFLAMPTPSPSPSPLTLLSPPSAGERLTRCMAPVTLPLPPLPPSSYPPPPVDRKDDYGFTDTVKAEIRHRGIREVGYGIRDGWIDPAEAVPEMAPTTLEKVNTKVTELVELHEHDTQDLYAPLEDAQDGRTHISQRVSMDSQRVDLLMGDRMNLQETVWIVEEEAYAAREAWAQLMQQTEMAGLRETDRLRQSQIVETLRVMRDMRQEMGDMQAKLLALRGQPRKARQPGEDIRVPNHQDAPRDADSPDAYAMTWKVLKKKMTDKYCLQGELKKLEIELWNLKFIANENEKIDKYISGLSDNIYRNVKSSKPRTLDETIELTNDLMDQKLRTYAKRADNKRKTDDTSRNNHGHQQQPFKKQNVTKVTSWAP
nr:hypothetical protein [Tanacetum cinerariifolium]